MSARAILIPGLFLMALAVMLGAFGAHALKSMVSERYLDIWHTATQYQSIHALGLILLSLYRQQHSNRWVSISAICFMLGVLFFSGSLYLLVLTGVGMLGMLTPIGGVLFIAGWLSWVVAAW